MKHLLVETKSGKIQGFEEHGLTKFLGIPYAQKPVNELRFKRARKAEAWGGVLQADRYGDAAPQFDHGRYQGSEYCLTLNIVRKAEDDKLPVFVWIHGGGFMTGCASDPLYAGESFARDGILYVSIQYRLNVLGFFNFSIYQGCEDFETNRGLSDMVIALQWIHENIEAFGGDSENITVGGESAGGSAVTALLAVTAVRGCFQKAIAESAVCNCVTTLERTRENMDLYMEGMGWTQKDLGRLRTMPAEEMIPGVMHVSAKHQYKNPGIFLPGPVIDDLLPVRPLDAIRAGSARGVKLLIGTNLHEGTMFVHPENTGFPNSWEMVREMFIKNGNENGYADIQRYYLRKDFDRDFGDVFVHFATDYAFEMPAVKAALAQREYGDTYMYRFEFLPKSAAENGMLVSHAFELPCVFDVRKHEFSRLFFEGETQEASDRIVGDVHRPWVNFIKSGEPDPENWPLFEGVCGPVRVFDRRTRTEQMDRSDMMAVWGDLRFYEE